MRRAKLGRALWVIAHFRVCDDSTGDVVAEFTERRDANGRTFARTVFTRSLTSAAPSCRSYRVQWRPAKRLHGAGTYRVELRVRDAAGAWSAPISKSFGAR